MPGPLNRKVDREYVGRISDSSRNYADRISSEKTNELIDILIQAGILVMDINGPHRVQTNNFLGTFKVANPVVELPKDED
jgi:hypothetical protein